MPRPPSRREQAEMANRQIRPGGTNPDVTPNATTVGQAAPNTVGEGAAASANTAGDPNGLEIIETAPATPRLRSLILPSGWAGLPDGWQPLFAGTAGLSELTDTAWTCVDLNASIISTMPPYLTGTAATPSTPTDWIHNPNDDLYTSWEEFAKQLVWDYMLGEVFVVADAFYGNGYPARFHVVEPWAVNVEMEGGFRSYRIGSRVLEPNREILHVRYKSTTSSARGIGPLEVGRARMIAAALLHQYAVNYTRGAVPQWLEVEESLDAAETSELQTQWIEARAAGWGFPAVLSGGIKWNTSTGNPKDLALVDLSGYTDARIAVMLGVVPFLAGLPSGGDSMTYSNVLSLFDYHWRAHLRTKVSPLMSALSQWLLPRGSRVEVNRDSYVQPGPTERAEWYRLMLELGVMTVEQIKAAERLNAGPAEIMEGVLR